MLETLASGLIIAAITGITFLAYKHPDAYKELHLPSIIFKIGLIFLFASLLWNYAINLTFNKVSPYIKENDIEITQGIIEKTNIPISLILIMSAVIVSIWFYLVFLSMLPWFLKQKQD